MARGTCHMARVPSSAFVTSRGQLGIGQGESDACSSARATRQALRLRAEIPESRCWTCIFLCSVVLLIDS